MISLIPQAHAQVDIGQIFGPARAGFRSVSDLVNVILPNILTVVGVITLIIVVVAGLNVIAHAGSGESQQLEKDQKAFTAAVIGLILVFGAYFLVQIIGTLVGFDILNPQVTP